MIFHNISNHDKGDCLACTNAVFGGQEDDGDEYGDEDGDDGRDDNDDDAGDDGRDDNDQSTQIDLWRMLLILTSSSLTHLLVPPSRCFVLEIDLHFWKLLCLEEGIVQIIQAI